MRFDRRSFLQLVGASSSAAALGLPWGCSSPDAQPRFPQGIGSGDPLPESVVLWTRVEPPQPAADVAVLWEVARDEAFAEIVTRGEVTVLEAWDHTVRIKVTGLTPGTRYWYRFRAGGATSPTGRTRTAPLPGDDVPVRFALASCQDFSGRWFHTWRVLADERDDLDFVLFLGDYIYETIGHLGEDVPESRSITLPDGLELDDPLKGERAALTLADYRALYRTYRADPELQRIHARYPFITVWDDHEFANDCWQDHATDFDGRMGDEPSPDRRAAGTRAWFEYQALDLTYDAAAGFPGDLRIWRPFRWGRHADIGLTDQRYYRDDHVIPEGPVDREVGKFLENSALGSRTFAIKSVFDEREAAARPTMLGAEQRAWLGGYLTGSDATWKIWASPNLVSQLALDLTGFEDLPDMFRQRFYFKLDHWDGFRSERAELLASLAGVDNLVVLSGDIHSFCAAELRTDFDAPGSPPVGVEYTVGAISSPTIEEQLTAIVEGNILLSGIGLGDLVPRFDAVAASTNPHLRHIESTRNGVALVDLDATEMRVTFLQIPPVTRDRFDGGVRRLTFRTPAGVRAIESV